MKEISGYVLAGGESSRMQAPGLPQHKAFLTLNGKTLLENTLTTLRTVCTDTAILCGPAERTPLFERYGRVVPDRVPGLGPVSGLDAALRDASAERVLVMPVDLPLLPLEALRRLTGCDIGTAPSVACFSVRGRLQPLPVLLHRSAQASVTASLVRHEQILAAVLQRAGTEMSSDGLRVMPVEAFATETDASTWFTNVNSPDDLRAARELLQTQNGLRQGASE